LFVAPSRLIVAPNENVTVINAANKSKVARRYDLAVVDEVMNGSGVVNRVETYPYSVKHMLRFQPKRFTLQPGEDQTVRIMIVRPAGLADGDYHSHLIFREVPLDEKSKEQLEAERQAAASDQGKKSATFEIRTLYGIGVPVIVQQGKIAQDLNIGDVKLGAMPDGNRQLSIDFTRTGNSEAAAKLSAQYVQPGKPPVSVIDPQWVRLYREIDKVSKDYPLTNIPKDAKGGKIVISLAKSESDDSKTVKKEIAFN
jgi:hypothetical protein